LGELLTATMAKQLYYDLGKPSAFSTLNKLAPAAAAKKTTTKHARSDIGAWLLQQDAYTMHRSLRKRFPRNPYVVTNIMDVWEFNLVDVQSFAKYNVG
jgi:hypothetical protein